MSAFILPTRSSTHALLSLPPSRGPLAPRLLSTFAPQLLRRSPALPALPRRRPAPATSMKATQMETPWNPVKVLESRSKTPALHYLVLDAGVTGEKGSLADSYRVPGQYVQVRKGEDTKPMFLAVACAPNIQGVFEFYIKKGPNVEWITELAEGDVVEMSPVAGKGYNMSKAETLAFPAIPDDVKPTNVLLICNGSGIAPLRAAIESPLNGVAPRKRESVTLYYGVASPEELACPERFKLWEDDGVKVVPVFSQEGEGRKGYVQDALKEDGVKEPKKTVALLCGLKDMTVEVKSYLMEQGVPEDRILFNF